MGRRDHVVRVEKMKREDAPYIDVCVSSTRISPYDTATTPTSPQITILELPGIPINSAKRHFAGIQQGKRQSRRPARRAAGADASSCATLRSSSWCWRATVACGHARFSSSSKRAVPAIDTSTLGQCSSTHVPLKHECVDAVAQLDARAVTHSSIGLFRYRACYVRSRAAWICGTAVDA